VFGREGPVEGLLVAAWERAGEPPVGDEARLAREVGLDAELAELCNALVGQAAAGAAAHGVAEDVDGLVALSPCHESVTDGDVGGQRLLARAAAAGQGLNEGQRRRVGIRGDARECHTTLLVARGELERPVAQRQ